MLHARLGLSLARGRTSALGRRQLDAGSLELGCRLREGGLERGEGSLARDPSGLDALAFGFDPGAFQRLLPAGGAVLLERVLGLGERSPRLGDRRPGPRLGLLGLTVLIGGLGLGRARRAQLVTERVCALLIGRGRGQIPDLVHDAPAGGLELDELGLERALLLGERVQLSRERGRLDACLKHCLAPFLEAARALACASSARCLRSASAWASAAAARTACPAPSSRAC